MFCKNDNSTLFKVLPACSGEYIVPSYVTFISEYCFINCAKITSVRLQYNYSSIRYGTFKYCTSLENINFPNSLTEILHMSFYNCRSLASITIPESVKTIEPYSFNGCTNLKSITFLTNKKTISIGEYSFSEIPNPIDIFIIGNFTINIASYY